MDKKSTKKTVTPNPYKATALDTVKEIDKGMLQVCQAVDKLMPVAQVQSVQDANFLIERAKAVEGRFSLAVCKLYHRIKTEELYKKQKMNSKQFYSNFAKWAEDTHGDKKSTAYSYARVGAFVNENGNGSTLKKEGQKGDYHYSALVIMVDSLVTFDKKSGEITSREMLDFAIENDYITPLIAQNRQDLKNAIEKVKDIFNLGEEIEEDGEVEDGEVEDGEVEDGQVEDGEVQQDGEVEKNLELSFTRSQWAVMLNVFENCQGLEVKEIAKAIKKAIKDFDKQNA